MPDAWHAISDGQFRVTLRVAAARAAGFKYLYELRKIILI
jgi:hypothetical protein